MDRGSWYEKDYMVLTEIKKELKKVDNSTLGLRKFGFQIGAFLAVLGILLRLLGRQHFAYLLYPGIAFVFLGALFPVILYPFQRVWMPFAITVSAILGKVITPIFLSVLFFLAITPIGLIMRLAGKDLLDEKLDPEAKSYWKMRPQVTYHPADDEKQF